jgi:hypothetical protein
MAWKERKKAAKLTLNPSNDLRVLRVRADFGVAAGDFLWMFISCLLPFASILPTALLCLEALFLFISGASWAELTIEKR